MQDLFKRLGTTGTAYAAGSIAQKVIAVALLPIYTRHLTRADYGAVEVLLQTTFAIALVVRFGMVDAMFRFYALRPAAERQTAVVSAAWTFLLVSATCVAVALIVAAEPVSQFLLGRSDPGLVRIAAAGLWILLLVELLLAIFRMQERAREYLLASFLSIGIVVIVSVWLVVFKDDGAEGLLVGNFAGPAVVLVGLAWTHRALLRFGHVRDVLRPMIRFGGPVMSAEVSLYAVNVIDRIAIVRFAGLAEAGLYAIAMKLSQGAILLLRGFDLAWAPLAYSITDDDEARRFYARTLTYILLGGAVVLLVTSLEAPWIVRAFTAPAFYPAHKAVPLISLAVVLYALYLTIVVAVGRVRQTRVLLAAGLTGLAVDAVLLVILVPPLGMIGASIALVGCFVAALPVLYWFVQRLFPLPFEWRRLVTIALTAAATYGIGVATTPESGTSAFLIRAALVPLFLILLGPLGFWDQAEREQLSRLFTRPDRVKS